MTLLVRFFSHCVVTLSSEYNLIFLINYYLGTFYDYDTAIDGVASNGKADDWINNYIGVYALKGKCRSFFLKSIGIILIAF